jgi:benzoylformate decarboxylase
MNDPTGGRTAITGRTAFVELLASEGVDVLFGNPGTTELAIMEAIGEQSHIRYVLGLQESIVTAMADGYARASGRIAAVNVHVAPGLGNALGAIYNAKFYGSPLLVTAGQQEQGHGLMEPLLYEPLLPMVAPLVKWAVECTRVEDLPRILRRAVKVALTPPTGPVFLSLPGDVLDASAVLDMGRPTRVDTAVRPNDATLARLADRLLAARNPVLLAGHELATRNALDEAERLAEVMGAPVLQQTIPCAAHFRTDHPAFLGALTRNQQQVRDALAPYDLIVGLGADFLRMSVYSPVDALPPGLAIVQIGERDWELGKNWPAEIAVRADIKETLAALVPVIAARMDATQRAAAADRLAGLAGVNWTARRAQAAAAALKLADRAPLEPAYLMKVLADVVPVDAVVIEEGLTSTAPMPGLLHLRDAQGLYGLASGGIGFAVSGAIGVSLALPGRPVVAVIGDGSAMYGIQALWTAANLGLPITYVIANNRSYRILKERMGSMRGTASFIGMDLRQPSIDFVGLAQSMGVPATRVAHPAELEQALRAAIATGRPALLDVSVADGFGG